VKALLEKGLAYRDFGTTEELKIEREAAEKEKKAFLYSRRWMAESDEEAEKFKAEGADASRADENAAGGQMCFYRRDSRRLRVRLGKGA